MEHLVRKLLLRSFTGEREILLTKKVPSREDLWQKFQDIDALGLYLHIPLARILRQAGIERKEWKQL